MKSFKLNDNGDLEFDNLHDIKMVDGIEEVRQRIRLTLATNLGEWFLNLNFGYPWIELLQDNAPQEEFEKGVVKILNNDPAITEVEEINLDIDREERKLTIDFIAIADEERFHERVVI